LFEGQESDESGRVIGRPVEGHADDSVVSRGSSRQFEQVLETVKVPVTRWVHVERPDPAQRQWEVVKAVDESEPLGHTDDGNAVKSGDRRRK